MTRDGIFASHRLNQLEVVPYAVPYPQVDLYGVVRCFPVALPPRVGLIDGKKRVKRKAPCAGPFFIDSSRRLRLGSRDVRRGYADLIRVDAEFLGASSRGPLRAQAAASLVAGVHVFLAAP